MTIGHRSAVLGANQRSEDEIVKRQHDVKIVEEPLVVHMMIGVQPEAALKI